MSSVDKRLWVIAGVLFAVAAVLGVWTFWPDGDSGSPRDDSSQQNDPDPSGSSDPTGSDVPKPVLPDTVKKATAAGAESAIRYHFEALNYMSATGDSSAYREIVDLEQCTRCKTNISLYEQIYRDGGYVKGGEFTVTKIAQTASSHYENQLIAYFGDVTIDRAPVTAKEAGSDEPATSDRRTSTGNFELSFDGVRWRVFSAGDE